MSENRTGSGLQDSRFRMLLERAPWKVDWFAAMRWIQALERESPRFGRAGRPADEPIRVGQRPSLRFAPATLSSFEYDRNGRARLEQYGFGLFGPNGPMPLHLTEHARALAELDKDAGLQAFADLFHHRLAMLFFRAWADVQSCVSLDRPEDDRFGTYLSSLIGYGEPALCGRDTIADGARRFMAGHLVRQTRNPEGLISILASYFGCAVRVEERRINWLSLAPQDQTALGEANPANGVGVGALCGARVPDRVHRFRLHLGPLDLKDYESFLPDRPAYQRLRDWVRNYIGFELCWDVCLILRAAQVPNCALGGATRLGWTSWLGGRPHAHDRADLVLDCEARSQSSVRPAVDLTPVQHNIP